MELGARIRYCRSVKKLTQRQLASLAGMAPEQLNRYEKGHASPSLATTVRIAHALGVRPGSLLDE